MTPETPSFYRLFRRSRYLSRITDNDDSDEANAARAERERFAVAALGFCLKHSAGFCNHFWERVCQVPGDPISPVPLKVEVEPAHWADLRLSTETAAGRFVWVVECKAGAALAPKQNPNHPLFCGPDGYGTLFARAERGSSCRYVVLGARERIPERELPCLAEQQGALRISQRGWSDLQWKRTDDSLVLDLFDSLGLLGIAHFRMKNILEIRVNGGLGPAATAWELLTALGSPEVCDFPASYWRISAGQPEPQRFYVGAYLKTPLKLKEPSEIHRKLFDRLQPSINHIAWVGYESGNRIDFGFRRSVWLYCRDEQLAAEVGKDVSTKVPDSNWTIERDECFCAVVSSLPDSRMKDFDWFRTVLETATEVQRSIPK